MGSGDPFGTTGAPPGAEGRPGPASGAEPPGGDSLPVSGTTQGPDGVALPGVRVLLLTLTGSERHAVTSDSTGAFAFRGVAPGSYRVEAWHPAAGQVDPPSTPELAGRAEIRGLPPVRMLLVLDPSTPEGGSVEVQARRDPLEAAGFYQRRAREAGSFLSPADIRQREAGSVSELVLPLPGFRYAPVGGGYALVGRRGCLPNLFLDGMDVGDTRSLDLVVPVAHLAAIEAYAGSTPPAEFAGFGSECGAVVLWTLRGG